MSVLGTLKAPVRPGSKVKVWHVAAGTTGAVVLFVWWRRKKGAKGSATPTAAGSATPPSVLSPFGGGDGSGSGGGGMGGSPAGPSPDLGTPGTPATVDPLASSNAVSSGTQMAAATTLSSADVSRIGQLSASGLTPTAISYGFGSQAPSAVAGSFLAPLPESSPGVFPYAAVPLPAQGGVYTGQQAAAFGATTYNPTPGYGKSAYAPV